LAWYTIPSFTRLSAATVDGLFGAAYLLLRDSRAGRSVRKFSCGLVVIDLATGRPCGRGASVRRNALLLPGANVGAVFFEAAT
jgi:hypothetical protein